MAIDMNQLHLLLSDSNRAEQVEKARGDVQDILRNAREKLQQISKDDDEDELELRKHRAQDEDKLDASVAEMNKAIAALKEQG